MIEIKHSKIRRKTVDLSGAGQRVSRIRRDPVPVQKKVEPISREQEILLAVAGVVLFALAIAAIIAGFNVIMGKDDGTAATAVNAPRFGACDGGADCVIDGDTVRIGGETLEVAGMRAPRMGSAAACPAEAHAGIEAVQGLTGLLNSGKVTTAGAPDKSEGQVRRTVLVNGKDVGAAMVAAELAREPGSVSGWCSE